MRLPRMTTRRWMIVVMVVGLVMGAIIGGIRLKRRHEDFLYRAQRHENSMILLRMIRGRWPGPTRTVSRSLLERTFAEKPELLEGIAAYEQAIALAEQRIAWLERRISYNAAMARKYRHAARYPWLPIEPDPPPP
jgi:hypothetical protein